MLTPHPHCPPWTLHAWPPLLWQLGKVASLGMQHIGTQVTNPGDAISRTTGQTLWGWHSDEGQAGMAWDWVMLGRGIVAMADPLAVVSNLRLVRGEGDVLSSSESVLHFNTIVHGLPWQDEVVRAIGADTAPAADALPWTAKHSTTLRAIAH